MNKKTRLIAFLLTLVMCFGIVPFTMFAQDDDTATKAEESLDTNVLDALADAATGTLYESVTGTKFNELFKKDAVINANGSYSGTEGAQAGFTDVAMDGLTTKQSHPGPNSSGKSLIYKNGAAHLTDSIFTLENKENAAKTDITYNFSGDTRYSNNNTKITKLVEDDYVVVNTHSIKAGEAFNSGYINRLRIYVASYTTTVDASGNVLSDPTKGKETRVLEQQLFKYDTSTGNLRVEVSKGVFKVIGTFSSDEYVNLTSVYSFKDNTVSAYANGILILTYKNVLGSEYFNATTTQTKGAETPDDTSDDVFTKVEYLFAKAMIDIHLGTQTLFSGTMFSLTTSSSAISKRSNVFDENGTLKFANKAPANGVFKSGDNYYFYENGILQGGKTVAVGNYHLVLEKYTGKIINCYTDVSSNITTSELSNLGAAQVKENLSMENNNNNGTVKAYKFATDAEGGYVYILDGENKIYADASLKKIVSDGAGYAYDASGAVDTLTETTAYAPLLDANGKQVTFKDGDTTVNVLVKVAAEKYSIRGNYLTASTGDGFNELTKKTYTSNQKYYKSTTDLTSGTQSTYNAADYQSVNGLGFTAKANRDYVLSFDIKAGAGINELNNSSITVGKLRWKNASTGTNGDDNAIFAFRKNNTDGKYHLSVHGVDCGPLSEYVATNITLVFTVEEDNNYDITVYCNGVCVLEKTDYIINFESTKNHGSRTSEYYISQFGVYLGSIKWDKPLAYIGHINAAAGTSTVPGRFNASVPFTGTIATNGKYIAYNNSILVNDNAPAPKSVELKAHSATLTDKIGLSFYVDTADAENLKANLTVDGVKTTINLKDAEKTNDGYKLTAWLSAIQLASSVTLEISDLDGNAVKIINGGKTYEEYNYTVKEYCEYLIASSATYGTACVTAAKSLLLYGAFAERYFCGEAGLATAGRSISNNDKALVQFYTVGSVATNLMGYPSASGSQLAYTATATMVNGTNINTSATATDPSKVGNVQLVLDSSVKIRIALTEEPTTVEGGKLIVKDGKYYVDIENITVADFNTVNTVTVDGNEIKLSALTAANAVVANANSYPTTFVNLMKAMYGYYYFTAVYAAANA